ncbi:hypothetical protein BGW38_002356 [Lunasporangiospora selenospora]|uniref:Uncharacterized protein n=1 Tax=Lunasporangiospora selenospora TaxID=979761 RepID=A0A9P6FSH0_9FUNG|nr:hypothetical protein BGW38_002356 [Lunasporangiospora selenospora]
MADQSQKVRSGQHLPNDVLLLIIELFHYDRRTLSSLLTVNWFFFHETSKILLSNPFTMWNIILRMGKSRDEDIMVLLLTSIVERFAVPSPDNPQPFTHSDVLEEYGLQWVRSPLYPLLEERLAAEADGKEPKPLPKLMMDYSLFFTTLFTSEWKVKWFTFIVPKLKYMDEEKNHAAHMAKISAPGYISEDKNSSLYNPSDSPFRRMDQFVMDSVLLIFIRYNLENVIRCTLDCDRSALFIPMAKKMSRLKYLLLDSSSGTLTPLQFSDTLAFIRKSQTEFPNKEPLGFSMTYLFTRTFGYDGVPRAWWDDRLAVESTVPLQPLLLTLCETINRPKCIIVESLQRFYERSGKINLDRLEILRQYGNQPHTQDHHQVAAFLKRCPELRELTMPVISPFLFSTLLDSKSPKPIVGSSSKELTIPRQINKLEKLHLSLTQTYVAGLYALNDAMDVFGSTIIYLRVENYGQLVGVDSPYLEGEASIQLKHLPQVKSIGGWNAPCLRKVDLSLSSLVEVDLGGFEGCPLLQDLSLKLSDNAPSVAFRVLPGQDPGNDIPGQLTDTVKPLLQVFPKWNLPWLRNLSLWGMAAVRFNYDSLCSMGRLENLVLSSAHISPSALRQIPGQAHHIDPYFGRAPEEGPWRPLDTGLDIYGRGPWIRNWTLPSLQTMHLEGPGANVFCFEWLLGCPSLTSLVLGTGDNIRRIPLNTVSAESYSIDPSQQKQTGVDERLESMGLGPNCHHESSPKEDVSVAYLDSKMTFLSVRGSWYIRPDDWIALLVTCMPRVQVIHLTNYESSRGISPYETLESIMCAEEVKKIVFADFVEENSKRPNLMGDTFTDGRRRIKSREELCAKDLRLQHMNTNIELAKTNREKLGLVEILESERSKYMKMAITLHEHGKRLFVRKGDLLAPTDCKAAAIPEEETDRFCQMSEFSWNRFQWPKSE